jgi:hypothetical protein
LRAFDSLQFSAPEMAARAAWFWCARGRLDGNAVESLHGCYKLAQVYDRGIGTERDPDTALELFETACETGAWDACINAGRLAYEVSPDGGDHALELLARAFKLDVFGAVDEAATLTERIGDDDGAEAMFRDTCRRGRLNSCYELRHRGKLTAEDNLAFEETRRQQEERQRQDDAERAEEEREEREERRIADEARERRAEESAAREAEEEQKRRELMAQIAQGNIPKTGPVYGYSSSPSTRDDERDRDDMARREQERTEQNRREREERQREERERADQEKRKAEEAARGVRGKAGQLRAKLPGYAAVLEEHGAFLREVERLGGDEKTIGGNCDSAISWKGRPITPRQKQAQVASQWRDAAKAWDRASTFVLGLDYSKTKSCHAPTIPVDTFYLTTCPVPAGATAQALEQGAATLRSMAEALSCIERSY